MEGKQTGVYLCSGCGIGEALDMDALAEVASKEFKLPVKQSECLCGDAGVKTISDDLQSGEVNQVVIGACSPRVKAECFQFGSTQVVRANLREQVVWMRPAGEEDTQMMAADNLRMAATQSGKIAPPTPHEESVESTRVLVVGGGPAGLAAAREASGAGHEVLLVDKAGHLGGNARGRAALTPHKPPYRGLQENDIDSQVQAVENDGRITVKTGTTVTETSGMPGRYDVTLSGGGQEKVGAIVVATGWRAYDPNNLGHLGYGASPDVVTNVELEGMLSEGGARCRSDGNAPKAVAFIQCAGQRDHNHLPYCSSVCCAVTLKQALQLKRADPETMVYVVYDEMRTPGTAEEFYREAQEAGVIFVKGDVKNVGSDLQVTVNDHLLGEEVPMSGLDMVVLATGMVPNSTDPDQETPEYGAEQLENDINPESPITVAGYNNGEPEIPERPGTAPSGGPILNLQYRQGPHLPMLADGFADSHYICFPYETRRTGIYTCGPVRRPMDMAEAREDAAGAALKAVQAIHNASQGASVHPRAGDLSFPRIGYSACTRCRRCTVECPFGAIDEDDQDYPLVNPTRCRRCGTCMGACPVRTISFDNYSVDMLSSMIKSVEIPDEFDEKPRILVMACENDAYPALDMAGIARHELSPYVRIVPVRCLGSVSLLCISDALSVGYDGALLLGCKSGDDYQCHFVKGSAMAEERLSKVGETLKSMMLEAERVVQAEASIADSARLPQVINDFVQSVDDLGPNPFKGF